MQLSEKYRPQTWEEVTGQSQAVNRIKTLAARGLAGRAYWVSGPSGSGKTTMARILARDVAAEWDTEEIDGTTLTVAKCKELDYTLSLRGMQGRGRAIIVNESHGLRKDVCRYLLVALERIPSHAVWIFTTTNAGQEGLFDDCIDAGPLLSRCALLQLSAQTTEAFAQRALEIARQEGLDGRPLADYVQLVIRCKGNLRAAIQAVEQGDMLPAPQPATAVPDWPIALPPGFALVNGAIKRI